MSYFLLRLSCLQQGEGKVFVFSQVRIQQRTNRIRYLVISCLYGGRSAVGETREIFWSSANYFKVTVVFFNCVTFNIQDWYAVNLLENVLKVYWKRSGFLRTEAGVTVGNICQHNFSQAWTAFSKKKKLMVLRKLQKLLHKLIISVFLANFST